MFCLLLRWTTGGLGARTCGLRGHPVRETPRARPKIFQSRGDARRWAGKRETGHEKHPDMQRPRPVFCARIIADEKHPNSSGFGKEAAPARVGTHPRGHEGHARASVRLDAVAIVGLGREGAWMEEHRARETPRDGPIVMFATHDSIIADEKHPDLDRGPPRALWKTKCGTR